MSSFYSIVRRDLVNPLIAGYSGMGTSWTVCLNWSTGLTQILSFGLKNGMTWIYNNIEIRRDLCNKRAKFQHMWGGNYTYILDFVVFCISSSDECCTDQMIFIWTSLMQTYWTRHRQTYRLWPFRKLSKNTCWRKTYLRLIRHMNEQDCKKQ